MNYSRHVLSRTLQESLTLALSVQDGGGLVQQDDWVRVGMHPLLLLISTAAQFHLGLHYPEYKKYNSGDTLHSFDLTDLDLVLVLDGVCLRVIIDDPLNQRVQVELRVQVVNPLLKIKIMK